MSENNTNKDVRNDEIDLLDLFHRMGRTLNRWAKVTGRAFLISVVFLLKRWLPLSLSLVAGVCMSYFLKVSSESSYSSDLVLRNNSIPNSDMISYINRLHNFCAESNYESLAASLSITLQTSKNILDLSAYWIIDKGRDGVPDFVDYNNNHNVYDTINIRMPDRLDIRVKISSPQELNILQNNILTYIKNDPLFKQRNKVRLKQNTELLKQIDQDIFLLDSLQKIKYFEETKNREPKSGGQMIFLQEQKTQMIYPEIQALLSRKHLIEAENELYPEIVTVLSHFNLPARPENGTLFYGKYIIPLFVGIMLLILILLANRNKLKEVYKKY
jgi:hypothetical protein